MVSWIQYFCAQRSPFIGYGISCFSNFSTLPAPFTIVFLPLSICVYACLYSLPFILLFIGQHHLIRKLPLAFILYWPAWAPCCAFPIVCPSSEWYASPVHLCALRGREHALFSSLGQALPVIRTIQSTLCVCMMPNENLLPVSGVVPEARHIIHPYLGECAADVAVVFLLLFSISPRPHPRCIYKSVAFPGFRHQNRYMTADMENVIPQSTMMDTHRASSYPRRI